MIHPLPHAMTISIEAHSYHIHSLFFCCIFFVITLSNPRGNLHLFFCEFVSLHVDLIFFCYPHTTHHLIKFCILFYMVANILYFCDKHLHVFITRNIYLLQSHTNISLLYFLCVKAKILDLP